MADQQIDPAALNAAVAAELARRSSPQPAPAFQQFQQPQQFGAPMIQTPMMPAGMMGAPPAAPQALLVPLSLTLPDGRECTLQVQLGAEALQNPMGAVQGLIQQGYPVKAYAPRQQGGGGYGGGGFRGNGGGGGYGGGNRWGGR